MVTSAAFLALALGVVGVVAQAQVAPPYPPSPPSPPPSPPAPPMIGECSLTEPQVVNTAFLDRYFPATGAKYDCAFFMPTTLADGTRVAEYYVTITGSNLDGGSVAIFASNATGAAPLLTLRANDALTPIKASNVPDGMYIVVSADADATGDLAILVTTVANCTSPLAPVGIVPLALGTSLLLNPPLAVCVNPGAVLTVGSNGLTYSNVFDTTLLPASYQSTFITTFAADLSGLADSATSCYQAVAAVSPSGVVAEVFVVFNVSDPSVNSIIGSKPTEICAPSGSNAGRDAIIVTSIDTTDANATGEPVIVTLRVAPTLRVAYPPAYGAYPPAYGAYPPAYGTPAPPPFRIQGGEVGTPTPTSGAANLPCALSVLSALFAALLLSM